MAKFSFVLFALTASFAVAFGAGTCGQTSVSMRANRRQDTTGGRIVGGVEARPNSHPWIVSMQQYNSHFCGGTLIRVGEREESDIVVTAAHCVYDGTSGLTVSAGAHDLNNPSNGVQTVKGAKTVYHPAYNPDTTMNDIAVVKLATPIKFTSTVQPACLPAIGEAVPDGTEATVAGWGLTREGGYDTSSILMQVGVPTINSRECSNMYRKAGISIDSYAMICAGYSGGGKDSCQGDSGGPFVVKSGNGYTLQGVVSFGVGCARPGMPGVYSRVSEYASWLKTQVLVLSSVRN
jgi:transmembrane serine protease 3